MHYFITGGAGFIGSNMVDRLLSLGNKVTVYDNFSTGRHAFLQSASAQKGFQLVVGDTLDLAAMTKAMAGADFVFHFAANADVRFGTIHPTKDLEQNTIATSNVLEAMRSNGIKRIAFSSTGSVYGETDVIPTPENAPFPIQTSLYAASKVACECLIQAYCEGYGMTAYIFRFVSFLGPRYTHGHVFDFVKKLQSDPTSLHLLGDGQQKKSYLHVSDGVSAMLAVVEKAHDKVNIYNLGTDAYCTVRDSAGWISAAMNATPQITCENSTRGWIGDIPFIYLDTKKVCSLGWKPEYPIRQAVEDTVAWLRKNEWVYEVKA